MDRLPEIISTVHRRRRWSAPDKIAILEEAFRPGGSVAAAADRHDISRPLIYLWRRQVRLGQMPGVSVAASAQARFATVEVAHTPPATVAPSATLSNAPDKPTRLVITLTNGRKITVEEGINPATLAKVAAALDEPDR